MTNALSVTRSLHAAARQRLKACCLVALLLVTPGHEPAAHAGAHEIEVVARKFEFEPAEIRVAAGESVRLVIRSVDGTHGFSIPALKIDQRIVKDQAPVTLEFIAPPAGRYKMTCSQFCGRGHAQMNAALVSVAATSAHP
jgi:cytochrome c oxidase subunit 2